MYTPIRGGLRQDLTRCLRTWRSLRTPCRKAGQRKNRIPDMVNIEQRPVEADERTVVGHGEGYLIIGKDNTSAIGILVERSTGLTMLVHVPHGYKSDQAPNPLIAQLKTMPSHMLRSLTWDQGTEMRDWKQVAAAVGIDIYFCDSHSPWQRGTNEHTNGPLRQYFPKVADFSVHTAGDLERVAAELNNRPRQRLGFQTPAEVAGPALLR